LKSPFAVAVALLVAANLVALGGIAWNRAGEPEARLELSQRELRLPNRWQVQEEDSGLSLKLTWQGRGRFDETPLFDREKLRQLGFDVDHDPAAPGAFEVYQGVPARRVLAVLELEGDAWQRWIAEREEEYRQWEENLGAGDEPDLNALERAHAKIERDRHEASRLFVVDAGLDAEELRRRYPDRRRYALAPALVRLYLDARDEGPVTLGGYVQKLLVEWIHVPVRLRHGLGPTAGVVFPDSDPDEGPSYRAVLAFGRRYEPILEELERLD
jgi:hypothetical protein